MNKLALEKENNNINIFFLNENNLQTRLIEKELAKTPNCLIKKQTDNDLDSPYSAGGTCIVLMNYQSTKGSLYTDLTSTGTFNFKLVVYDVPLGYPYSKSAQWCNLSGIMYEDAPIDHLTRCINTVAKGDLWLPRPLIASMLEHLKTLPPSPMKDIDSLTRREQQILDRLVCGQSNIQIANELFVAESTVKTHIYKLYKKINVNCRKEAIRLFRQCETTTII